MMVSLSWRAGRCRQSWHFAIVIRAILGRIAVSEYDDLTGTQDIGKIWRKFSVCQLISIVAYEKLHFRLYEKLFWGFTSYI